MQNVFWKHGLFFILVCLLAGGCAETPSRDGVSKVSSGMTDEQYAQYIKNHSVNDRRYDGIYQVFEINAIMMNSDIQNVLLLRQGELMGWDMNKMRTEKERNAQLMSAQTRVVLSFFSPDLQNDDLSKSNSIWRVYLDSGGTRYEAKVKKFPGKLTEVRTLYPFHNRFSTAYECTFNIPATKVEMSPAILVVTSTLGSSRLELPGMH